MAVALPAKPLPMRLRRTPNQSHGFSSTSSATMVTACSLTPQPSSASTPKVAKRRRPDATPRTPDRKSASRTPPTTSSTPPNEPSSFCPVICDSWDIESRALPVELLRRRHWASEPAKRGETKNRTAKSTPKPFLHKPQKKFGTPRVSVVLEANYRCRAEAFATRHFEAQCEKEPTTPSNQPQIILVGYRIQQPHSDRQKSIR